MREIQTEIRRDCIENDNRVNELQNKAEGGLKTANTYHTPAYIRKEMSVREFEEKYHSLANYLHCDSSNAYVTSLNRAKELSDLTAKASISPSAQSALKSALSSAHQATEEYYTAIAKAEKELGGVLHNEIETYTRSVFDRMGIDKVQEHTEKVKKLLDEISAAKANADEAVNQLNSAADNVGRQAQTALSASVIRNAADRTVNTVLQTAERSAYILWKINSLSSNPEISDDLAKIEKEAATELTGTAIKKIDFSPKKLQTTQAEQSAAMNRRTIKTSQKKFIKTAQKRVIRNSEKAVKATKSTAKATAKATGKSAKCAKSAAETSEKIISNIVRTIGKFFTSKSGILVLAAAGVVVLIVLIFNIITGAIQAPITVISGIGSSLSWLFGGDEGSSGDVSQEQNQGDPAEIYKGFYDKAKSAMQSAKNHFNEKINEISFEESDILKFNETSYYPASSAETVLQDFISTLDYEDYPYLIQVCYIKKLREERALQGLNEEDMPEVSIEEADLLDLLVNYCYIFENTVVTNQSCPSSDCKVDEDDLKYCNNNHKKYIITIKKVLKDTLENEILQFSDSEKSMLETGVAFIGELTVTEARGE